MEGLNLSAARFANLAYSRGDGVYGFCGADSQGTLRKSINSEDLTVLSVLTYPIKDLAGDFVDPVGCDFTSHELDPAVDVEHSRSPEFGNLTIAKCQHPDGSYAQDWRRLTLDDGVRHLLPVAKSYFDRNSKPSMQVFALVERDVLPGVSLEFKAKSGRPLGPSPLEDRPAYHFDQVDVVRYTHCATPVNPGALTVTKSLDALIPVVQTGRIGSEALDSRLLGVLKKSVAQYTPRRVLVAGGFVGKAMDDTKYDDYEPPLPDSDATSAVETDEPAPDEEGPAMGGIAAMYAKAQALLDACDQNESDMQTSDSPELRKFMAKMRDKVNSIAEEIKAMADKHDAKLNGTNDTETDEAEGEPTDTDMDRDDEGYLKAIRPVYRKALVASRHRRFSLAEVESAAPESATVTKSDETPESIEEALRRIEREDPEGFKKIQRAKREHDRVSAWAD